MRYGFRIHELELARGLRGRRRLEPRTCTNDHERAEIKKGRDEPRGSKDYLDQLVDQLNEMRDDSDALTGIPVLLAVADGADDFVAQEDPGTPRLLVTDVSRHGRRVSVEVEYGHLGWHHRAVGRTRADVSSLTHRSPMQLYRIEFLVPDQGTRGLIAAETISGGHALTMLVAWLNHRSREAEGDDEMVRLLAQPLTELQRVLQLLDDPNSAAEIELKRAQGVSVDGVPTSGKVTLKEQVVPGTKRMQLKHLTRRWHSADFKYESMQALEEVRALAEVVAPAAAELEFTDGVIRLDPGNGRPLSVRPTKLGELYAYELSDHHPTPSQWDEAVRTKLLAFASEPPELSVAWS